MSNKNEKLEKWGYTISSLGGLLVILNFTTFKGSVWGLELSILAVVLALVGIMMIQKSKKETT